MKLEGVYNCVYINTWRVCQTRTDHSQIFDLKQFAKPRAHKPERATSMHSYPCVFTDQFIFRMVFGANFEYLLNSTNQSAKRTDLKMTFFAF